MPAKTFSGSLSLPRMLSNNNEGPFDASQYPAGYAVSGYLEDNDSDGTANFPELLVRPRVALEFKRLYLPIAITASPTYDQSNNTYGPLPTLANLGLTLEVTGEIRWAYTASESFTSGVAEVAVCNDTVIQDFENPFRLGINETAQLGFSLSFNEAVSAFTLFAGTRINLQITSEGTPVFPGSPTLQYTTLVQQPAQGSFYYTTEGG